MTTLEQEAAQVLEIHGRCRGSGCDQEGRICTVSAIFEASRAVTPRLPGSRAVALFEQYLRSRGEQPDGSIFTLAAQWNDRTEDDDVVRDTLLLAAKDFRAAAVLS